MRKLALTILVLLVIGIFPIISWAGELEDSAVIKCEVTRADFEDGNYEYAVGLKFIPRNTNYLKQFVEAIKA